MWVDVVGGRDGEIGRRWGFLTPRGRYRVYALGIVWPIKLRGGGHRGSGWGDVDTEYDVVGGQVGEIKQRWGIVAPRGRYRAYALCITRPLKMWGGECEGSVGGNTNTEVEVGGCLVRENDRGMVYFSPNNQYRGVVLNICWPSKLLGGAHKGCMWDEVNTKVEVMGSQVGENEWGGDFWPAESKIEPCSFELGLGNQNPSARCTWSVW